MNKCPICGGRLKDKKVKFHKNILHWRGGSATLGPVHFAITQMLLKNPGGLTTEGVSDRTGQTIQTTQVEIYQLKKKLEPIGLVVKNIGGGGRRNALYVLIESEVVR